MLRNPEARFFGATRLLVVLVTVMASLGATPPVRAQCDGVWVRGTGQDIQGTSSEVTTSIAWDPDGPGPRVPVLAVAGFFRYAGDKFTPGVALWDGVSWQSIPGLDGSVVSAIYVFEGELILATIADSRYPIRAWNGAALRTLHEDIGDIVHGFGTLDGQLIAAGDFSNGGFLPFLARWDGTSWHPLTASSTNWLSSPVVAMHSFNGQLVVVGSFGVAQWTGTGWQYLGAGTISYVAAVHVHQGDLFVGNSYGVYRWTGSAWSLMGDTFVGGGVATLGTFGADLIAGGTFASSGSAALNGLARWNGTQWSSIGGGVGGGWSESSVNTTCELNGTLFVGGDFTTAAELRPHYVAQWNGATWSTLGTGMESAFRAAIVHDGSLVFGGSFTRILGAPMNTVARWDGSIWHAMPGLTGTVQAFAIYNGQLVASGDFSVDDDPAITNIARWDGTHWLALGSSLPSTVHALVVFNNELVAAGDFSFGNQRYIARWNGSIWRPLGTGMNQFVHSLAVYNNQLYAGGVFTSAGGVAARGVARWTGSAWQAVGAGVTNPPQAFDIKAMQAHNGELFVGGRFDSIGGASGGIVRWNGSTWQQGPFIGECEDFATFNGEIFALGDLGVSLPNFQNSNGAFRWNGSTWLPMGVGLDAGPIVSPQNLDTTAFCAVGFNGELVIGGNFLAAGGLPSAYWARWAPQTEVSIIQQPQETRACFAAITSLNVVASGSGPLTYQWRKGGRALSNDAVFSGTNTGTLLIAAHSLDIEGAYDVVISNTCGGVTSTPASVTRCIADLDDSTGLGGCDGGVDVTDLLYYLGAFAQGTVDGADMDRSGGVDVIDLLVFLAHFEAGC